MNEPPPVETVSIDEMAMLEFTPWAEHDGEWTHPSDEEWSSLADPDLISVRLAWLTLHKSKDELIGKRFERPTPGSA